jgi:hypothetical protein
MAQGNARANAGLAVRGTLFRAEDPYSQIKPIQSNKCDEKVDGITRSGIHVNECRICITEGQLEAANGANKLRLSLSSAGDPSNAIILSESRRSSSA